MIRCRCGAWTNFGMTCSKCAADIWDTAPPPPTEEAEEEATSTDELEETTDDD